MENLCGLYAGRLPPFDHDLDFVSIVMGQRILKIEHWVVLGDQFLEMIPPTQPSARQVIDRHLKMSLRIIDTADEHLILEHKLTDQIRAINLNGSVAAGNTRQDIDAVIAQC